MTKQADNEAFVRDFQMRHGLPVDGWAGADTNAKLDQVAPISDDIPADYWPMLAKIESGARPYVKAPTSSASGLYQFIKSTWLGEGGEWGGDASKAFGGLKPTEQEQTQRARTFTEKNVKVLKAAGLRINKATLYAAHFLGAGMAVKLLGSTTTARADHIAGEAATNANSSILRGKLVSDFINWLEKKTGDRA